MPDPTPTTDTPDTTKAATPDATDGHALRATRRTGALTAAVVAVGAVAALWLPAALGISPLGILQQLGEPAPTETNVAGTVVRPTTGTTPLRRPLDTAGQLFRDTGSYDGLAQQLDNDVQVATSGDTVVLVTTTEDTCWVAAHAAGRPHGPQIDPSGDGCDPELLPLVATELDRIVAQDVDPGSADATTDTTVRESASVDAKVGEALDRHLRHVAGELRTWALTTGQSFLGASWPGADVTVDDDGNGATVALTQQGVCRQIRVSVTLIDEPEPCR